MVVQQHVLNWLYSVLTSEYHHVNPFSNGSSALLLHISGTIPVTFRGTTYRFPVSIWIPHAYPREPPLVYVTPTETMVVRPGQHVDPQGQVYHPYLVGWADFWDRCSSSRDRRRRILKLYLLFPNKLIKWLRGKKPPPPPDLMDEPLTLDIPSPSSVAPPPIPPNPEKDALLQQLASTLHQMRTRVRGQNDSSLQGLQAQRTAMLNAMSTMQQEVGGLTQLSNLLRNNTTILHDIMRRADETIENSKSLPQPDVDQLLVAPTVVGNQLYELVAEERALADAIFVVGRAVERGRVSPAVFAKTTRSLAREWYLKKALVKKIGRGMGLSAA
ncbi:hypothetical protein VP1G_03986 [Cytospora mali]|uniref:Tumor susceptibility gene 101 protein n=1 Tax=Cytospora mali TaxID=578113 RepID=A0A194UYE6_CYTMA|nr:hypothetical protein VP1G_03986 [Valsa mali var. pyri (nom. inval.)]